MPKAPTPRTPRDVTLEVKRQLPNRRPLGMVVSVRGCDTSFGPLRVSAGKCTIGSGKSCDLVVDHPTISRQHVELELVPEGVEVRDLGSRNGTYYLNQRVEHMTVAIGSRLSLADSLTLQLDADRDALDEDLHYEGDEYRGMVGASASMHRLFAILSRLEGSLVTVLIEGESGVGKELVALAIHEGSGVSGGPLVIVNCGAIPKDLIVSELFGHARGAFTGASERRKGAFESADGGTLVLDEVGELPLEVQPTLLRAIESGTIRRVGEDCDRRVRVRLVASTNRDLEQEVVERRFREDLFYRLAVVRLRIDSLRDRPEDVEPLCRRLAEDAGCDLPANIIEMFKSRSWPGNVRELRNAVQAYAALGALPRPGRSPAATLQFAMREFVDPSVPYAEQKDALIDQFTVLYLESLLERTDGNRTVAARIAGLDRTHLGRLIAKHGLTKR
jgi:two-component system, NtrC family, response regulator GlrR